MIVTFYSFKGGVGRSMALANVAELLLERGLRVMMVDFDLEAPGLERFFEQATTPPDQVRERRGVIDLLRSYLDLRALTPAGPPAAEPVRFPYAVEPLSEFAVPLRAAPDGTASLLLVPAGRRAGSAYGDYADRVRTFDWDELYRRWDGEAFFDWFREEAERLADVVLVDSRTGIAEVSGVCTVQLADVVVMLVAPNQQNLEGCRLMAESLNDPRLVSEGRRGRRLSLLPVPARVDHSESGALTAFAADFERELAPFVPTQLAFASSAFIDLKIPYVPRYAFVERVAAREPELPVTAELIGAYTRLTAAIMELAGPSEPVYQAWHGPPPIESGGDVIPVEGFTGREWALERVNAWLAADGPSVLLVTGPLGSGKTWLAHWLAESPARRGTLVYGVHACRSGDERAFVEGLIMSLAQRVPGFVEQMRGPRSSGVELKFTLQISANRAQGLRLRGIVMGDSPPAAAFDDLVLQPLRRLSPAPDQPLLVLVDGLDQAADPVGFARLLAGVEPGSPLRILVTSLPGPFLRGLQQGSGAENVLALVADEPHAAGDVRAYVERRVASLSRPVTKGAADAVAEHSAGNFALAEMLLRSLEHDPAFSLDDAQQAFGDVFRADLDRLLRPDPATIEQDRRLLGLLAIARGPLPARRIAGALRWNQSDVEAALERWAWLLVEDRLGGFRLFHPALGDLLLAHKAYRIGRSEMHLALARSLVEEHGSRWAMCEDEYALRHTLVHLLSAVEVRGQQVAGIEETAGGLIADLSFLTAKAARLGLPSLGADAGAAAAALARWSRTPGVAGGVLAVPWFDGEPPGPDVRGGVARLLAHATTAVVELYAGSFERLDADLPPGDRRTAALDDLVAEVRSLAEHTTMAEPDPELLPGERVVGLAVAQGRPDAGTFDVLDRAPVWRLSSFEQYHALLAAQRLLPFLDEPRREALRVRLEETFGDQRLGRGSARGRLLTQLLESLQPQMAIPPPRDRGDHPPAASPAFTGRDRELKALRTQLTAHGGCYVTGLAGVGKTQLALAYARQYGEQYSGAYWSHPNSRRVLQLTGPRQKSGLRLLVVDGADEPIEYSPGRDFHLLVISRNSTAPSALRLGPLPVETAAAYLQARTGESAPEPALEVAEALGGLPLALEQAVTYIAETGGSLRAYAERLRRRLPELLSRGAPADHPEALGDALGATLKGLEAESPAATALLRCCAFLPPIDIPLALFAAAAEQSDDVLPPDLGDELGLDAAIAALRRHSLVDRVADAIQVHRLVQAIARKTLPAGDRVRYAEACLRLALSAEIDAGLRQRLLDTLREAPSADQR